MRFHGIYCVGHLGPLQNAASSHQILTTLGGALKEIQTAFIFCGLRAQHIFFFSRRERIFKICWLYPLTVLFNSHCNV